VRVTNYTVDKRKITDGNVYFRGDKQTGDGYSVQWQDEGTDRERQLTNK